MGKSKKRILHKTNSLIYMTRENAISEVSSCLKKPFYNNKKTTEAKKLITLFGLSAEELSEAGVGYECLKSMDTII